MNPPPAAVIFDVGGVLFIPDPALVAQALSQLGINVSAEAMLRAHYAGMAQLDADLGEHMGDDEAAFRSSYLVGVARELVGSQASDGLLDAAVSALAVLGRGPASQVWTHAVPGAKRALESLSQAGVGLAVVSNSDGTVEAKLAASATCQVGEGPGVPVAAVVDSSRLGISKPDPAIFDPALKALGLPPSQVAYLGDSVHYDVVGARRAGMIPLHFDPFLFCARPDHLHLRAMDELCSLVVGG